MPRRIRHLWPSYLVPPTLPILGTSRLGGGAQAGRFIAEIVASVHIPPARTQALWVGGAAVDHLTTGHRQTARAGGLTGQGESIVQIMSCRYNNLLIVSNWVK